MSPTDIDSVATVADGELRGLIGRRLNEVSELRLVVQTLQNENTALKSKVAELKVESRALKDEVARPNNRPPRLPTKPPGMEQSTDATDRQVSLEAATVPDVLIGRNSAPDAIPAALSHSLSDLIPLPLQFELPIAWNDCQRSNSAKFLDSSHYGTGITGHATS
jgi:hypothetical protein